MNASSFLHQRINSANQKTKDYYILTFQYFQTTAQFINLKKELDSRVLIVNITPNYPGQLDIIAKYLDIAFTVMEDIQFINIRYVLEEECDVILLELTDKTKEEYYLRFTRDSNLYIYGKLFPHKTPIFKADMNLGKILNY